MSWMLRVQALPMLRPDHYFIPVWQCQAVSWHFWVTRQAWSSNYFLACSI